MMTRVVVVVVVVEAVALARGEFKQIEEAVCVALCAELEGFALLREVVAQGRRVEKGVEVACAGCFCGGS